MILVECPLCHDPERPEDIVGGVCLTCADAIAFAQNARRASVVVEATDERPHRHRKPTTTEVREARAALVLEHTSTCAWRKDIYDGCSCGVTDLVTQAYEIGAVITPESE